MHIRIFLEKEGVTIEIIRGKIKIADLFFQEKYNLSNVILFNLDKILEENRIDKKDIKKVLIKSTLPDSYTSTRIAKSLEKSFNFAIGK